MCAMRIIGTRFLHLNGHCVQANKTRKMVAAVVGSNWRHLSMNTKLVKQEQKNQILSVYRRNTHSDSTAWTVKNGWLTNFAALIASLGGIAWAYFQLNESSGLKVSCEDCDCAPKKCKDSDCLRKMESEEAIIEKANSELEKALKDVKPKAVEYTEAALRAYCEAYDFVRQFMDKAYCAIEDDGLQSPKFEEVWCDVYTTAKKRCDKVKDAMTKGQTAWELLCRLREVIENGKNCKYTNCNPLLITAEEAMLCAERELLNAKTKMDCVQSESIVVEQYKNLIEDFRRDLKAEMESLMTSPNCEDTFTQNECSLILTHAYKKVLRCQKELAQTQVCSGKVPQRLAQTLC